jgi:TP901 family phage tail tape measure protein
VIKPDLSMEGIQRSFSDGIAKLKSNFQAGMQDVSVGVLGQLATNLGTLANPAGAAAAGIAALGTALKASISAAIDYDAALTDVAVITGASGEQLQSLGNAAQQLAIKFGTSVNDQLSLFSLSLSKIGPQLADNQEAFKGYIDNVNTFAKAAGISAAEAGTALADVMAQLGVNFQDSNEVLAASTEYINVMAKGAQLGAATVSQVAESMLQAGSTAKQLGIGVVEANAAIQALALGGKVGSEAGVGLRNVLLKLSNPTKEAQEALAQTGLSFKQLQQTLSTSGLQGAVDLLNKSLASIADPTQRAAVLAKMFGAENVAAAGALLNNAEAMRRFAQAIGEGNNKIQGQGAAFEQASTRMRSWSEMIARVRAVVEVLAIKVGGALLEAFNQVIEIVEPAFNAIKNAVSSALNIFSTLVDSIGSASDSSAGLRDVWSVIKDVVSAVLSAVASIAGAVLRVAAVLAGAVVGAISRAWQLLTSGAKALYDWVASLDVVRGAIEIIKGIINEIVNAWTSIVAYAKDLLGLSDKQTQSSKQTATAAEATAKATEQAAQASKQAATDWAAMAARLETIVARAKQLYETMVSVQQIAAQQAALRQGLLSPTLAQQIELANAKLAAMRTQLESVAGAAVRGLDLRSLLDQDITDVSAVVERIVAISPAVVRAKKEAEDASGTDKAREQQERYQETLQRTREQVQRLILEYQQQRTELGKLNLQAQIDQAKRLGEEVGAIKVDITPEMTLDAAAINAARARMQELGATLRDALAAAIPGSDVARELSKALAALEERQRQFDANLLKATEERDSKIAELRRLAIADDDERDRVAKRDQLQREMEQALKLAELYKLDADTREQIRANFVRRLGEIGNQQIEQERKQAQVMEQTYRTLFDLPAQVAEALAKGGEDAMRQFKATVLNALLDIAQAQLTFAIFGVTAQELATKGIVGLGTAAVAIALIQALFAAAKAALQRGFKAGGWTGNVGTDDVAGVVHGREFVVRAPYAERWRPMLEIINAGGVPSVTQQVRVALEGALQLRLRDGWIDAPRYVQLRARVAS